MNVRRFLPFVILLPVVVLFYCLCLFLLSFLTLRCIILFLERGVDLHGEDVHVPR